LILISCVWLSRSPASLYIPIILKRLKFKRDYSQQFFIALLLVQAAAGILSYTFDLNRPFSESKNAANLMLKDKETGEYLSAGCGAAPVSAYLEKKVYHLNVQKYGSFCQFGDTAIEDEVRLKKDAVAFITKTHRPAFLITHIPLGLSPADSLNIMWVGNFERSALRNESYYIYRVQNNGL